MVLEYCFGSQYQKGECMTRLTLTEMDNLSIRLPKWILEKEPQECIRLDWEGTDFEQTFDLMIEISKIAIELNHHPDWCNSFRKLSIRLTTHDVGGLSTLDIQMAERINQLLVQISP